MTPAFLMKAGVFIYAAGNQPLQEYFPELHLRDLVLAIADLYMAGIQAGASGPQLEKLLIS